LKKLCKKTIECNMEASRENILNLLCASLQRNVLDVEDLKGVAMRYRERDVDAVIRTSALDLVVDALDQGIFTVEDLKEAARLGCRSGVGYGDGISRAQGENNVQFKDGDWICEVCENLNFARRKECHRDSCRAPRPLSMNREIHNRGGGETPWNAQALPSSNLSKPGDWNCEECGYLNFARRAECNSKSCKAPRPVRGRGISSRVGQTSRGSGGWGKSRVERGGDWNCGKCEFMNFARRTECKDCGEPRDESTAGQPGAQRYNPYGQSNNRERPGDWVCKECNMMNFSRRDVCHRTSCKAPRPEIIS